MNCSICQSALPRGYAVLCSKCDLYHINGFTWDSVAEFLEFLNGKKFVYQCVGIGEDGRAFPHLKEFADAIVTSPDVLEVYISKLESEDLIAVFSLLEKLPNCTGVQLTEFTITKQTSPYVAKIISLPCLQVLALVNATFTPEACQALADSMDPDRFSILSLEGCNIPNATPIINALINSKINIIPEFLIRPFTDEECSALANVIKRNKHIKTVRFAHSSCKNSLEIAEALEYNENIESVRFYKCDLTTGLPALVKSIRAFKNTPKLQIILCDITLALLTDFCNGIEQQKVDVMLQLTDTKYDDSLEPITFLLERTPCVKTLALATSSPAQEWISLINALKNNTTLTSFSPSTPTTNEQVIDAFANTVQVNTTLKTLNISSYPASPVLDPLIKAVLSQNNIESCYINDGRFRDINFATLCGMLKKNTKLLQIDLGYSLRFPASDENVRIFQELMEQNYFLLDCRILAQDEYYAHNFETLPPYHERNGRFKKEWNELKQNMVVLLHNMARNAETIRNLLPIEIWLEVFKRITHYVSPDNGLEHMAKDLFAQYKLL